MRKYAIVTGVASGIGECIANNFIENGIHVFGLDKNTPNNDKIEYFKCDISDEESIISTINKIAKKTECITKAGIEMFSKILALELMEDKIRVNTIALASVKTNFLKDYKKDEKVLEKMMETTDKNMPYGIIKPYDVYKLVEYLVEENNKITGQTILIDSGVDANGNR